MPPTDTSEKGLETLIVNSLIQEAGYEPGSKDDYNVDHAVDLDWSKTANPCLTSIIVGFPFSDAVDVNQCIGVKDSIVLQVPKANTGFEDRLTVYDKRNSGTRCIGSMQRLKYHFIQSLLQFSALRGFVVSGYGDQGYSSKMRENSFFMSLAHAEFHDRQQ